MNIQVLSTKDKIFDALQTDGASKITLILLESFSLVVLRRRVRLVRSTRSSVLGLGLLVRSIRPSVLGLRSVGLIRAIIGSSGLGCEQFREPLLQLSILLDLLRRPRQVLALRLVTIHVGHICDFVGVAIVAKVLVGALLLDAASLVVRSRREATGLLHLSVKENCTSV